MWSSNAGLRNRSDRIRPPKGVEIVRLQPGRTALPIVLASLLAVLTVANSAAQPNLLVGPSAVEFAALDAANQPTANQPAPQTVFVASSGDPLSYPVSYTHLRAHETRHDL